MLRTEGRDGILTVMALLVGAVIVAGPPVTAVSAFSTGDVAAAPPPPSFPSRTGIWPVNLTLYGDATRGWGFNRSNITEPGPPITVYFGDTLNLTLIGADAGVMHNWFVDYNNDSQPSPGEPTSPDFMSGSPLIWNFTTLIPGTWTYRCGHHPASMTGTIVVRSVARPVRFTLHGDSIAGWGFSNATIHEPGPSLVVLWSTNVTFTLIAHDSATHNWFIDFNGDLSVSAGEPASPDFGPGNTIVWSFSASESGNWTYRCHFHPTSMTGNISIVGGPPPELPRATLPLITEIMVGALSVVLVIAVAYHVRAMRAAKRIR